MAQNPDAPQPDGKPLVLSKTVWFNLLLAAFMVFQHSYPVLTPELADALAVLAVAFVNPLLRWITSEGITRVF